MKSNEVRRVCVFAHVFKRKQELVYVLYCAFQIDSS